MRVPSRLVLASIVHTTIIISLMWQMTDSAGSSDKQSVNNDITISQQRINLNDDNTFYCRSRSNSLSMAAFRLETCYLCYYYMPQNQFIHGAKWTATSNDDFRVDGFRVPRLTDNNGTKVNTGLNPSISKACQTWSTYKMNDTYRRRNVQSLIKS